MADVQVRGCCCGVPFGCGTVFLLVGCLFLWKLASPEVFGAAGSQALLATLATAGAGVLLSLRIGRGGPPAPPLDFGPRAEPPPGDPPD